MAASVSKFLVFRNHRTKNWRIVESQGSIVDSNGHKGYQFYRSVPTYEAGQQYAAQVEKDEKHFKI